MDMTDVVFTVELVDLFVVAAEFMVGHVFVVPFFILSDGLVLNVLLLSHKVDTLIQGDDYMEQILYTLSVTAHGRHDRHTQQTSQFMIVECVSALLKRVEHV